MGIEELATIAEFTKIAAQKRRRRRGTLSLVTAPVRKPFKEALTFGAAGAVVGPGIAALHRYVEHKGKTPKTHKFYTARGKKVPAWLVASALSGFTWGGVIPYLKQLHKTKRPTIKVKTAQGHGAALLRPPHRRGLLRAFVPEATKRHAKRLLTTSRGSGRLRAGEYRP